MIYPHPKQHQKTAPDALDDLPTGRAANPMGPAGAPRRHLDPALANFLDPRSRTHLPSAAQGGIPERTEIMITKANFTTTTAIPTIPTVDQLRACEVWLDFIDIERLGPNLDWVVCCAVLSQDGNELVEATIDATVGNRDFYFDVMEAKIIGGTSGPEDTIDLELESALIGACVEALATTHLSEILSQIDGFRSQVAAADA